MMGKISLHPHVPLGLRLGPRSMGKMQFRGTSEVHQEPFLVSSDSRRFEH